MHARKKTKGGSKSFLSSCTGNGIRYVYLQRCDSRIWPDKLECLSTARDAGGGKGDLIQCSNQCLRMAVIAGNSTRVLRDGIRSRIAHDYLLHCETWRYQKCPQRFLTGASGGGGTHCDVRQPERRRATLQDSIRVGNHHDRLQSCDQGRIVLLPVRRIGEAQFGPWKIPGTSQRKAVN